MRRRSFLGLAAAAVVGWAFSPRVARAQQLAVANAPHDAPADGSAVAPSVAGGLPLIVRFGGNADPVGAFIDPLAAPRC